MAQDHDRQRPGLLGAGQFRIGIPGHIQTASAGTRANPHPYASSVLQIIFWSEELRITYNLYMDFPTYGCSLLRKQIDLHVFQEQPGS